MHPRWHVERHHIGCCTIGNRDFRVVGLAHEKVLVGRGDGASVGHLGATRHGERRWSHGDTFQFAQEVAGMRWLVIADALPYHTLTILMVVPQRVVAIRGRDVGRIDAYILVV